MTNDSVKAATRVLNHLEARIRAPARNPGMGHVREDLADRRHRFFPVGYYLIVYRSETKPPQIVRILHASRDVQEILDIKADDFDADDLK